VFAINTVNDVEVIYDVYHDMRRCLPGFSLSVRQCQDMCTMHG